MKTEKTRLQELAAGIEDDMKTTLGSLYKGISIETKGLPLHSQESISIHESGSYSAAEGEPFHAGENPYNPAQYISFDAFKANLKKTLGL